MFAITYFRSLEKCQSWHFFSRDFLDKRRKKSRKKTRKKKRRKSLANAIDYTKAISHFGIVLISVVFGTCHGNGIFLFVHTLIPTLAWLSLFFIIKWFWFVFSWASHPHLSSPLAIVIAPLTPTFDCNMFRLLSLPFPNVTYINKFLCYFVYALFFFLLHSKFIHIVLKSRKKPCNHPLTHICYK